MIMANRTTKEDLRYNGPAHRYDKGAAMNFSEVFCENTPSMVKEHVKKRKIQSSEGILPT